MGISIPPAHCGLQLPEVGAYEFSCESEGARKDEEYVVRNNRLGLVQFGDTRRLIFLNLVPGAKPGDYILAHVGFNDGSQAPEEPKKGLGRSRARGDSICITLPGYHGEPGISPYLPCIPNSWAII